MKVKELIEALQRVDGETLCVVNMGRNELANGEPVDGVVLRTAYRTLGEKRIREYEYCDEDEVSLVVVNIHG